MGIEAGMALSGAGAVSGMFGAYRSASAQKAALQYQANVAANNAILAREQASIADQTGQTMVAQSELKTASLLGEQRAAMAANGVDLGTGSANEVLATSKFMGDVDALTIHDNANRQKWAYLQQGKGFDAEAAMDSSAASGVSPWSAAVGSLLGSAGKVSDRWYDYQRQKGLTPGGVSAGLFSKG